MEISRLTSRRESADVKIKVKTMLTCFIDCKVIVHREFALPRETVNQKIFLKVLKRSRQRVRRVGPEFFTEKWILHHDNAQPHIALSVKEFLAKEKSIVVLEQSSCSSDLSPCNFHPFLLWRIVSRDHILKPWIQKVTTSDLNNLQENGFWKWKQRWNSCIAAGGNYFEGDRCNS